MLYPGVPELLRRAIPHELFVEPSSWPQNNEKEEETLRQALLGLEKSTPAVARERVLELEKLHGSRRRWVWAKLDQAPLAHAIGHLARLVEVAATKLGGASLAEMARLYADGAWEADAAALAAAAAVKSTANSQAVSKALNAVYRPWLESAAEHLQALAEKEPLPGHDSQPLEELLVEPGGMVLFADGLPVRRVSTPGLPDAGQGVDGDSVDAMGWTSHCDSDGQTCGVAGGEENRGPIARERISSR